MKMLNWVQIRARIRYENVDQSSGEVNVYSVLGWLVFIKCKSSPNRGDSHQTNKTIQCKADRIEVGCLGSTEPLNPGIQSD